MDFDLDKEIADLTKPQEQAPAKQGIRVDLGDGRVWDFKDDQELSANLKQAFTQMTSEINELKTKAAQVEETQKAPQGQYVQGDTEVPTRLDTDAFIKEFAKDPYKAIEMVLPHTEAGKQLKAAKEKAESATKELEAQKFFQANPEFVQHRNEYGNVLEKVRQQLGFEFNQQGLEAAYAIARERNIIPNFKMLNQVPLMIQQLANRGAIQVTDPQLQQMLYPQGVPQQGQTNQGPQYSPYQYTQTNQPQQTQYNPWQNQGSQQMNLFGNQNPGLPTMPRTGGELSIDQQMAIDNLPLDQLEALVNKYRNQNQG